MPLAIFGTTGPSITRTHTHTHTQATNVSLFNSYKFECKKFIIIF